MGTNNLYGKSESCLDLYGQGDEPVSGIDLREGMHELLYDEDRGADIIYRRSRLEDGVPKKCACTKTSRSQEANKDIPCTDCNGLGYYYTDLLTRTYINHSQAYSIHKRFKPEGVSQVEYKTAYFEWDFIKEGLDDGDNIPSRFDMIIQLKKDLSGKILSPSTARETYEILSVEPYRLDNNGRIEYYRCRIISVIDKSFLV